MANSLMARVADHLHGFTYNKRRWRWAWMYPGLFAWHGAGGSLLTAEFVGNETGEGFSLAFQFQHAGSDDIVATHVVDFTPFKDEPPAHLADYVLGAAKGVVSDIMRGRYVIRTNPFVPYP